MGRMIEEQSGKEEGVYISPNNEPLGESTPELTGLT